MAKLFPFGHIMGFLSSVVLTLAALSVLWIDVATGVKMAILIVTTLLQASLQLFLFMHAGESEDKGSIFTNVVFAAVIGLITIFGSILAMVWDW
ncbi:MAG: cytochrome aa3 quinol oxidase subunit IV [Bacillus sp. (in: firmicutes)]